MSPGQPSISAYRNPWNVNRGSQLSPPPPQRVVVGRAAPPERPGVDLAVLQDLGVADAHGAPAGPLDANADAPDEVLAEVEDAGAFASRAPPASPCGSAASEVPRDGEVYTRPLRPGRSTDHYS